MVAAVPKIPPPGYALLREGRLRLLVRDGIPEVTELLRRWAAGALPPGRALAGGRGGTEAFALGPHCTAVLRPYRRGGLVRWVNRSRYLGFRPRPFRELAASVALRDRGVPTPEVLGAALCWDLPGCYRGALASREVEGATNLWRYLQSVAPAERREACRAAAAAARRLHDAGAVHPDLNLQNFLVRSRPEGIEVWVIDLDGVRLGAAAGAAPRRAAFERLCRSIRRLDHDSAVVTPDCVAALREIC